jgi:hypothetical protein
MALKEIVLALGMIVAASPLSATSQGPEPATGAPVGTPETRYCMHIEAITGSRIEQGVDVDKDWAKEGVRTIG